MGIHAKYDLTPEALNETEPKRHFSIDRYVITIYNMDDDLPPIEREYDTWEEVHSYMTHFVSDPFFDNYNYSVTGLVFN